MDGLNKWSKQKKINKDSPIGGRGIYRTILFVFLSKIPYYRI